MWGQPAHPGKMGSQGICLEQFLTPRRLKILFSLKQILQGHSQGAAATLVPQGLSQDDVQDMSVGRGNVVCEAADTGEDFRFCRDGCESETKSPAAQAWQGKMGPSAWPRWEELLSRGG